MDVSSIPSRKIKDEEDKRKQEQEQVEGAAMNQLDAWVSIMCRQAKSARPDGGSAGTGWNRLDKDRLGKGGCRRKHLSSSFLTLKFRTETVLGRNHSALESKSPIILPVQVMLLEID